MDASHLHALVDRKMTLSTEAGSESTNADRPPAVPDKTKVDPDAPPGYQPPANGHNQSANTSTNTATSAYTDLTPAGSPLHSPPAPNEISIPFYSNPAPGPDHPALQADRKEKTEPTGVLSDSPRIDGSSRYACLTLHSNDKLGSTNLSAEITNDLDGVIRSKWAKGVQKWAYEDGGWCWQLNGKPWSHGDLATPARELLLALLTRLSHLGYSLHTSLLSSPGSDKDSLILRKTSHTIGQGRDFFGLCFYKSDRIKVIDCPDDTVKEAITTAIKVWPEGIRSTKEKGKGKKSNNHSWKLKGTPWKTKSGDGESVTASRALLCAILDEVEGVGWELAGSVKMTKPDDNRDLDTWIFSNIVR